MIQLGDFIALRAMLVSKRSVGAVEEVNAKSLECITTTKKYIVNSTEDAVNSLEDAVNILEDAVNS